MGGWGLGGRWEGSQGRGGVTGQRSPQSCSTFPSRASPPQLALETTGRGQGLTESRGACRPWQQGG